MLETAWSRSDFSFEETASADSSPAARGATVSADSTASVTKLVKGEGRPVFKSTERLALKLPVTAGRRRPMSRFFVAPLRSVKLHTGRSLGGTSTPGAVASTVAPAGGVNVAFTSAF